jgi:hypothetical protein
MLSGWSIKRVLIVVKTYPTPAHKGVEVSCTAGVTQEREWIRLYPVPFRFLEQEQQFARYQWIDVQVRPARNDPRPESHNLNDASIQVLKSPPPVNGWGAREQILAPLRRPSLCHIDDHRQKYGHPTLGLFRPARIKGLNITQADEQNWTPSQLAALNQARLDLGGSEPKRQLEKIPFEFRYEFDCAHPSCKGHSLMCTDWEMGQSFRKCRRSYGSQWEAKFRDKYEREMIERRDTSFYVGTVHQHPNRWIIVGLFYPPKPKGPDLFTNL